MVDDADSHELLAVVAAVHHHRVGETLNDRAAGLAESLGGISAGGVGDVDGLGQVDVVAIQLSPLEAVQYIFVSQSRRWARPRGFCVDVRERDVANLDIVVVPLVEQLDVADLLGDILGEDV